jgi:AcrR family transcriptional regulator
MTALGVSETQGKLVRAAAHLFARQGIETVPLRDVGARAGQRNASAVQYHFGDRWALVEAILARHHDTVVGWEDLEGARSVEEIVEGLVDWLRPKLADADGRDFLRVVFELMARYPGRWDEDPWVHRGMANLVDRLVAALASLPREVARVRAVAMTQFVSYQLAERSRVIDESRDQILDEDTFVANLVDMSKAMLCAPAPRPRSPEGRET